MEELALREIIFKYLLPMFPGSHLLDGTVPVTRRVDLASFHDPCTIALSIKVEEEYRILMRRSQQFSHSDVVFVSWFMDALGKIESHHQEPFFAQLLANAIPEAISGFVTSRHQQSRQGAFRIIRQLENWAAQTYEGQPITCAIGIDANATTNLSPTLDEMWAHDFSAVLTSGLDTVLVVTQALNIVSFDALPPPVMTGIAPYRLSQLAEWTNHNGVLFSLNRNGEILVFFKGKLSFAKRRGRWFHFPHDSMAKRLGRIGTNALRQSVYETCLDVSFARTGGCIAVVSSGARARLSQIVHNDDMLGALTIKSRCLTQIVNTPFPDMDRRLRQELVAIDGATILDHNGILIAAGAIVEVPPGSRAGARWAAAAALSECGLAIKISHDGGISGFKGTGAGSPPEITFEIG